MVQSNLKLTGVLRFASDASISFCTVNSNCFFSNGNSADSCASGVNPPEADASCAICPSSTLAEAACTTPNSIGLQSFNEAGDDTICLAFDSDPRTIAGGACTVTVSSTISSIDAQVATFTSCSLTFDGDILLEMNLQDGGTKSIVLTQLNDVACGGTLDIDLDGMMRKRQTATDLSLTTSSVFITASTATGDPHLVGAHGEHFDFFGQPNGVYSLFSTPQFDINMKLLDHGPENRFINEIGIVFRNVTLRFDSGTFRPARKEKALNAFLEAVGGKATVKPFEIELELCEGHRVTIVQRFASGWKVADKAQKFYFLNIEIQVPGCHDSYGGVLGQTYQCKYSKGEKFQFSHDDEESFRVKRLFSTSGSFSTTAPCHEMSEFEGQRPQIGGSMDGKMAERVSMGAVGQSIENN